MSGNRWPMDPGQRRVNVQKAAENNAWVVLEDGEQVLVKKVCKPLGDGGAIYVLVNLLGQEIAYINAWGWRVDLPTNCDPKRWRVVGWAEPEKIEAARTTPDLVADTDAKGTITQGFHANEFVREMMRKVRVYLSDSKKMAPTTLTVAVRDGAPLERIFNAGREVLRCTRLTEIRFVDHDRVFILDNMSDDSARCVIRPVGITVDTSFDLIGQIGVKMSALIDAGIELMTVAVIEEIEFPHHGNVSLVGIGV